MVFIKVSRAKGRLRVIVRHIARIRLTRVIILWRIKAHPFQLIFLSLFLVSSQQIIS